MTDIEKTIKRALIDNNMRATELVEQVKAKTGMYFDMPYLAKFYNGTAHSAVIITAINEILGIEVSA